MPRPPGVLILAVLLALPAASGEATAKPVMWQVLADCAAAYQANAGLADPDRPAAMSAQVSDVARDYMKAAEAAYRPGSASRSAAHRIVAAHVAARTKAYGARSREAVEAVIDACPQIGG
jgi:hypothetical protein